MKIILLGAPGIGKGTHGDMLSVKLKIPKICTGDMLRSETKKGTAVGKKAKVYMDRGDLVPDSVVLEIMENALDGRKDFILDGFPRTLAQAKSLEKTFAIDMVINFVAPNKEVMERVTGRLTCGYCGEIYHHKFAKPKKSGTCDKCNGQLYVREDQKADVVRKRLDVYEKLTRPLVDYYKKKGMLLEINVSGSIEDVKRGVWKSVNDYIKKNKLTEE
ncbi:MAG: nucleoside monophosphate kinase [Candidatus Aenigmarchaeota archaeon]|nr:nucleoside monophosphate kinase [Candidatus Aenigmarchaeota archaeon]